MSEVKNKFWVDKYQPTKISECILPKALKAKFQAIVDSDSPIPNMSLVGPQGCSKTTVMKTLFAEKGYDSLIINASLDSGIDTLRTTIRDHAGSQSFDGSRKGMGLDEADYLQMNSTQPALRGFITDYQTNCTFILTANYKAKILGPLLSRCPVVEFVTPADELEDCMGQMMARAIEILELEGIKIEGEAGYEAIANLVSDHYPDMRSVLLVLENYSRGGVIDGALRQASDPSNFAQLVNALKGKNFNAMRQWVAENSNQDVHSVIKNLYSKMDDIFDVKSRPAATFILGQSQHQEANSPDKEIFLAYVMVQLAEECKFI